MVRRENWGCSMTELEEAVERLRLEMMLQQPPIAEGLKSLEQHLLHERDAILNHIRHIKALRQESSAMIRGELESLREVLIPVSVPAAPAVPVLEERFTAPRILGRVA